MRKTTTPALPKAAILLCRLSDRDDDLDDGQLSKGIQDQEADLRAEAAALGWGVLRVVIEDGVSAYKKRKVKLPGGGHGLRVVRPKWRGIVDDLRTGRADGVLAYDGDRVTRDHRDFEDLVEIVLLSDFRVRVRSITGSCTLESDSDIDRARDYINHANRSSRDTSRRVKRARLRKALAGEFGGGGRRFGFEADGKTRRESECAEIAKASDDVVAGVTLYRVKADWTKRGIQTVTGVPWRESTIKGILLRPRNAGLVEHQGEIVTDPLAPGEEMDPLWIALGLDGKPRKAAWESIVPLETWVTVRSILTDPARKTSPGNRPQWLGSGIYRCGHADCISAEPAHVMRVGTSGGQPEKVLPSGKVRKARAATKVYRCVDGPKLAHVTRDAVALDAHVEAVIVARLEQPDAAELLAPPKLAVDAGGLHRRATALREALVALADEKDDPEIRLSNIEYKRRRLKLQTQLDEIEAELSAATVDDPLEGLAGNPDAGKLWKRLSLDRKRAVLDTMYVVTVLPAPKGRRSTGRYFDPEYVQIERKPR